MKDGSYGIKDGSYRIKDNCDGTKVIRKRTKARG